MSVTGPGQPPLKSPKDFTSAEAYEQALHTPGNRIECRDGRIYVVGPGGEWRRADLLRLAPDEHGLPRALPRATRHEKKAAKRRRHA
jgi:hypothetical protein